MNAPKIISRISGPVPSGQGGPTDIPSSSVPQVPLAIDWASP